MNGVVVVHAGAGTWRFFNKDEIVNIIKSSLKAGVKVLERGGSALDAVVEATVVLEDSGILNAGLGSVVDVLGRLTMDAGVMDGYSGRAGAVAAVTYPKNPVVLARKVMELTDHIILCGSGADELAIKLNLPKHPGPTERVIKLYKEYVSKADSAPARFAKNIKVAKELGMFDTVGAVALDNNGRLAAAVSTGGIILKFPGRVGDSAIPGAGFYANRYGAAVATGVGETIIMSLLTYRAVELMKEGYTAATAARIALQIHTSLFGRDTAGLIVVDRSGMPYGVYNTQAMPWGYLRVGMEEPHISGFPEST